jgi:hypothetical protein
MGDMQVAILLDAGKSGARRHASAPSAPFNKPAGKNATD